MDKKYAGIYIHFPFCTTKCHYCDFYSITDRLDDIDKFVDCLIKEIKDNKKLKENLYLFDTIFFGGGTPSLLDSQHVEKILASLSQNYKLSSKIEITIESNPNELSLNKLKDLKASGVNRLSIGFQSLDDNILKVLSREHSSKQCINGFKNARKAKFDNINIDLIYSVPGQKKEVWLDTLSEAISLDPDHISCYSLTVEKNTKLHSMVKNNEITIPSQDIDYSMFCLTRDTLLNNNYNQYEISNFSKITMECKHNLHYWALDPYLALGPSASGYDGEKRWKNTRSLDNYIKRIENNKTPITEIENLSLKDSFNDLLMNGLRLSQGVSLNQLESLYSGNFSSFKIRAQERWANINIKDNRMYLDRNGQLICDLITSDLFI